MQEAQGYSPESDRAADWAESRIAEIMGVLNAATAELVSVIAEVLRTAAWGGGGLRSPEHWVAWKAGVSPARAKALVRMARRRGELPALEARFAEGRISEDAMRHVARRVPSSRDAEVAELADVMTVPQLAKVLRSLPQIDAPVAEGAAPAAAAPDPTVSFGNGDDDSWWLRAEGLPPESGAIVERAMTVARDAELADRGPGATVTWSDALVRMGLAALDALDPATKRGGLGRTQRYQVLVHIRAGDESPSAHLHLGPALSAAARRRITCDAPLRWVLEEEGRPVAWGRLKRTVEPVLRRLIEDRDRGCRVPGCAQTRWIEVHHIRHVEDGGETVDDNLICLCPRHHRAHHDGRLGIRGDPTRPEGLVFTDEWGRPIQAPPPTPPSGPLGEAARAVGLQPTSWVPPYGEPMTHGCVMWSGAA